MWSVRILEWVVVVYCLGAMLRLWWFLQGPHD